MYDFLRGSVIAVDTNDRLSFEVNGVGYLLKVSKQTRAAIPLDGKTVYIYVRLVVREDDLILFGFHDVAERFCFDLLTTVQGVGPVMAMAILSAMTPSALRTTLTEKLAKNLSTVKGVGPKSAERIIAELSAKADKIPAPLAGSDAAQVTGTDEQRRLAKKGLVALGFAATAAGDAVELVCKRDATLTTAEPILRAALAVLR